MRKPITKCPHCGSDRGMAVRFKATGTDIYIYIVLMDIFKMKKLLNAVHIINV